MGHQNTHIGRPRFIAGSISYILLDIGNKQVYI